MLKTLRSVGSGLTLRQQLIALFTILLSVLGVAALLSLGRLGDVDDAQFYVSKRLAPYAAILGDAALEMKAAANDERGYLMTGDAEFRKEIGERQETVHASLADAREVAPNAGYANAVDTIGEQFDAWTEAIDAEFKLFGTDREAAIALALGENRDLRKAYEATLAKAIDDANVEIPAADNTVATNVAQTRDDAPGRPAHPRDRLDRRGHAARAGHPPPDEAAGRGAAQPRRAGRRLLAGRTRGDGHRRPHRRRRPGHAADRARRRRPDRRCPRDDQRADRQDRERARQLQRDARAARRPDRRDLGQLADALRRLPADGVHQRGGGPGRRRDRRRGRPGRQRRRPAGQARRGRPRDHRDRSPRRRRPRPARSATPPTRRARRASSPSRAPTPSPRPRRR